MRTINDFLNIDLNKNLERSSPQPEVRNLFVDEDFFSIFQKKALNRMRNKWIWVVLPLMGVIFILPVIFVLLSDPMNYQALPEWNYNSFTTPLNSIFATYRPIFYTFTATAVIATLLICILFVYQISQLGKHPEEKKFWTSHHYFCVSSS